MPSPVQPPGQPRPERGRSPHTAPSNTPSRERRPSGARRPRSGPLRVLDGVAHVQPGRPARVHGDTVPLKGEGLATSLHSSVPALLHAPRTRHSMNAARYLNQSRATYRGGMSELDAALHLLHLPDEDLEVGEVTILVDVAHKMPPRPRLTNPVYDGTRPTPWYAVVSETFPREPTRCPALPPPTKAPRGWAHPRLSSPPFQDQVRPPHGAVPLAGAPGHPPPPPRHHDPRRPGAGYGAKPTHLYGA